MRTIKQQRLGECTEMASVGMNVEWYNKWVRNVNASTGLQEHLPRPCLQQVRMNGMYLNGRTVTTMNITEWDHSQNVGIPEVSPGTASPNRTMNSSPTGTVVSIIIK
jgi:hypothetical protein